MAGSYEVVRDCHGVTEDDTVDVCRGCTRIDLA